MNKKFFYSLFFVIIIFCFGSCDEENINTFKLSLGENVFLLEPTVIDTKKVSEGINITVFVLIPDDKILDRFEINNVEKELENGDVYKFRMSNNTKITASFKGFYSLDLAEGISVVEPKRLDLDKVKEGERLTIKAEVTGVNAVESFKLNDNIELSEFTYKLGDDKIYAETSFIIEDNTIVGLKYSDKFKIPPINFYKKKGDDVLFLKKQNQFNGENILIPNFVTIIERGAFGGNSVVNSILMLEGITHIEEAAFYNCSNLVSINIPKSVSSISGDAFKKTPWYNNINSEAVDGLVIISDILIWVDENKEFVEIPEGVLSIGGSAFDERSNLISVVIPNSVTSIGDYAFYKCNKLSTINIPESVTNIGKSAFGNCSKLANITIPYGIKIIEARTFEFCENLSSIVIPDSVEEICFRAFGNCDNFKSIIIPSSVSYMGFSVFIGCSNLKTIYCSASDPAPATTPEGWKNPWIGMNCSATVVWGYTGD